MLRTVLVATLAVLATMSHAEVHCPDGVGFHYLPADPDDEMLWWEYSVPQLIFTENTRSRFVDEQIVVNVYVTMIEDGSNAANYVDLELTEDGILVGTEWQSLDDFEREYRTLLCHPQQEMEGLRSAENGQ